MSELPGGRKLRVLLAQALFGRPEALLLDEPTNHLDLDSIHWLRDFLLRYEGTLVVISHDRHFLNAVCTHTADIDYETIITYAGGYDDMVMAKTQIRARLEANNEQREKKIAQLNDFIARFSAGTRSSQLASSSISSGASGRKPFGAFSLSSAGASSGSKRSRMRVCVASSRPAAMRRQATKKACQLRASPVCASDCSKSGASSRIRSGSFGWPKPGRRQ